VHVTTRRTLILKLSCLDKPGIVAAVAGWITENNGNILESAQYGDEVTERFFMRIRFDCLGDADRDAFARALQPIAARFGMNWTLVPENQRGRVIVVVSKSDHCLNDLLYRWRTNALPMDLVAVVSNHEDARDIVRTAGIPFHHWPVTPATKPEQEAKLLALVEAENIDLVVLARYMQVLSNDASNRLFGKAINIHHSFLPSFKGARPYHQAHGRGVKLIGATAHYITPDLDEGPIIEQDAERVTHAHSPDELVRIGRDIEALVLARAVKWHLEHRILLNDGKTVVFT
jgi:formyltetrahydrofolate deformylase